MSRSKKLEASAFLKGKTAAQWSADIEGALGIGLAYPGAAFSAIFTGEAIAKGVDDAWWYILTEMGIRLPDSADLQVAAQMATVAGVAWFFNKCGKMAAPIIVDAIEILRNRAFFRDDENSWPQLDWEKYLANTAALLGRSKLLDAIDHALGLMGVPSGRSDRVDGFGVIVCHQKHLKSALNLVLATMQGEKPLKQFTIIHDGNFGLPGETSPAAFHIREDGSAVAVWADKDGMPTFTICYDANSLPTQVAEVIGSHYSIVPNPPFKVPNMVEAAGALGLAIGDRQKAIQDAWERLRLDRDTHKVTVTDGAVIVRSLKTNKVDNPHGPAVILPDGRELFFKDGRNSDPRTPSVDANLGGLGMRPSF